MCIKCDVSDIVPEELEAVLAEVEEVCCATGIVLHRERAEVPALHDVLAKLNEVHVLHQSQA